MVSIIASLQNVSLALNNNTTNVKILHNINLEIYERQTISLVGPSGSGKSSLLMLLSGLEACSEGKIIMLNQNLSNLSEDQLATFRREHIGIIFQAFHLIPTMTSLENVAIPLELANQKNAFDRAEELLDRVGLTHRLNHFPSQMSGGEQQRVAIARALTLKPNLILADEPTGNLDAKTGEVISDLLFELASLYNSTLIIVTHSEDLANRCDHRLNIKDGCIQGPNVTRKLV